MFSPDDKIIDFAAFTAAPTLPPQNPEMEMALLGGLLLDGQAIEHIAEIIDTPAVFYLHSHATVYRGCLALHAADQPIDLLTLTSWLTDQKLLDKVGGRAFLVNLIDCAVSAVNLDIYARLLLDKYLRRRLLSAVSDIERSAHDGSKSAEQILDESEQLIYAIADSNKSTQINQGESTADISPRLWRQLEAGKTLGIPTGFLDLDAMTGGLYPGTLMVAAGRTAMGKSQFAVALTYEVAARGLPVVFFSCEMSKEEIANRLLARIALIDSAKLRDAKVEPHQWEKLAAASSDLSDLKVHILDLPRPSAAQMRAVLRRVQKQYGQIGLVVLDYIQLLGDGADNRVNELDRIVRDFRDLAKEFHVPALGLAQINRGVEQRSNKRPLLSDIRDCGGIEQHADVVLLLYRDSYYNPSSPDRGLIEIEVAKNRGNQTGVVKMLFSPEYSLLRNLARGVK